MPIPFGSGRVTASTQTHSPSGIRSRWTVRSTLMKRKRRQSSDGADPVADVGGDQRRAAAARAPRPAAAGQRMPHPDRRRPRLEEAAAERPPLHRRVVAGVLAGLEELRAPSPVRAGRRLPGAGRRLGQVELEPVRIRQPRARISSPLGVATAWPRPSATLRARADDPRLDRDRADRHRAQDLEGDRATWTGTSPPIRSSALDLAADQRRRAGRRAGRPGPRARGSARWPRKRSPSRS